jgi:transcriptional regulator with XRE-family HTH domain
MTSDPILTKFGEQVRTFRKVAGLSQEELADQADMHRTYISGIERGERNISLLNLVRLANALKISLSQLMEGLE